MKTFAHKFGLNRCLAALGLAKSSYYFRLSKKDQVGKYDRLREKIIEIIKEHPAYGYRRLVAELKKQGTVINHKTLRRLLKSWRLSLIRKTKKVTPSGILRLLSDLGAKVNLISRITEPGMFEVVCADITEINYAHGKVYLAANLDMAGRKMIGWATGVSPDTALVLKAAHIATEYILKAGADLRKTIFHQDQGSVYTSYAYAGEMLKSGASLSYSRRATPGDNAHIESFFGRLKEEWGAVFANADSEREVKQLIDQAIIDYNGRRLHSALGYMSPNEYIAVNFRQATHTLIAV